MNKFKNIYYSQIFWLVFFLISSLIYFKPFLTNPAFNLIDDGVSIRNAQQIRDGDFQSLIEISNGRIRSVYWLYFVVINFFSGFNPLGYWVGQTFIFSLSLFLIWNLIRDKSRSILLQIFIAISLMLLFFIPAISENLYRLGTAEVRQIFLMLIFINWMTTKQYSFYNKLFGSMIFLLSILTKETSIMLLPIFIVYTFPLVLTNYKKYKYLLCYTSFLTLGSTIFYFFIIAMKEYSTYTSNLTISLPQIKNNILISRLTMSEIYYLLIILLSLTFLRFISFVLNNIRIKNLELSTFIQRFIEFWLHNNLLLSIATAILSSLFFIYSWGYQLERYYYPVYIFLFIYSFVEIIKTYELYTKIKEIKFKSLFFITPIFLIFISYFVIFQKTYPNLFNYIENNSITKNRWLNGYQRSYRIIKPILENDYEVVYATTSDYEVVYELGLYNNKFSYQKNKKEIFSPNKDVAIKYEYINYTINIKEAFIKDKSDNKILITTEDNEISFDKDFYTKEIMLDHIKESDQRPEWVIWRKK